MKGGKGSEQGESSQAQKAVAYKVFFGHTWWAFCLIWIELAFWIICIVCVFLAYCTYYKWVFRINPCTSSLISILMRTSHLQTQWSTLFQWLHPVLVGLTFGFSSFFFFFFFCQFYRPCVRPPVFDLYPVLLRQNLFIPRPYLNILQFHIQASTSLSYNAVM